MDGKVASQGQTAKLQTQALILIRILPFQRKIWLVPLFGYVMLPSFISLSELYNEGVNSVYGQLASFSSAVSFSTHSIIPI